MNGKQLQATLDIMEMSQTELGNLLDIDPRTVRRYIANECDIPLVVELALLGLGNAQTFVVQSPSERVRMIQQRATIMRGRDKQLDHAAHISFSAAARRRRRAQQQ